MNEMRKLINLIESAQTNEAPIGSYGDVGSIDNKFDKFSTDSNKFNPAQKVNLGIRIAGAVTLAAVAGKNTYEFFDPSSIEGMIGSGAASVFAGILGLAAGSVMIPDVTGIDKVHQARQDMSKKLAVQISKDKPEILKDVANFKKEFLNNTPSAILKESLELANIVASSGEMRDYADGDRFSPQYDGDDIIGIRDSNTLKRTKVLIRIINEYVAKYDAKFDSIAEKHNMTPQDLTAFVYYVNGEDDLAVSWFENIKSKAGLQ